MENKLVISNSSPLMNLAIIGQLNLLEELFAKITIPEEVWKENRSPHTKLCLQPSQPRKFLMKRIFLVIIFNRV